MIQVRCPRCGSLNQVAAGGGAIQICCYACRSVFPASSPDAAPVPVGSPVGGGRGLGGYPPGAYAAGSALPVPGGGPLPPHQSGALGSSAATPQAAVEGAGSGALAPAFVDRQEAGPSQEGAGGMLLVLLLAATVFVVLGAALLVTLLVIGGKSKVAGDRRGEVVPRPLETEWIDAAGKTLEIDEMRVRVDRVEFDRVRGRDHRGTVITTDEKYLSVIVNVRNATRTAARYDSWHSGSYPAVLTDEGNQVFEPFRGNRFKSIEWHVPEETLERMQQVDDRLVFIIPPDVNRDRIEAFRLELPAQAVGREGAYRLRIPVDMVEGF